jgi:conjugative relaxase-like TrwC/TraI family protein
MIFINHMKSAKAAKDYYTQHIAPGDGRYYTAENAAQVKGVWHGRGAEMLQLSGEVAQDDFFRLCDNLNPQTGEQLTPRTKDDRRVLTDLTFDAPKSVTLVSELGGDDRILDAFRQSVRETMAEIESSAQARVRKGGNDTDRTTGNMACPIRNCIVMPRFSMQRSMMSRIAGKRFSSATSFGTRAITRPLFTRVWPRS